MYDGSSVELGLEPGTLGLQGQYLTSRPVRPVNSWHSTMSINPLKTTVMRTCQLLRSVELAVVLKSYDEIWYMVLSPDCKCVSNFRPNLSTGRPSVGLSTSVYVSSKKQRLG
ncbi:hypothetical protein AVEN_75518-1 [Araneus ventricosus]|uniref:Uncharacterized protein n=1 Tax=Araneus ventricosus TaxID=182803 RepID=A0A4Y2DPY8_ARAVE|nr:hypothetical protein AVEN_75518-1 [Araneus ventricosus]